MSFSAAGGPPVMFLEPVPDGLCLGPAERNTWPGLVIASKITFGQVTKIKVLLVKDIFGAVRVV